MTGLLAVVAVVGYMATAGLPWWVVVAVALLMAGFAAGRSGSPGKGARSIAAPDGSGEGARSAGVPCPVDGPVRTSADAWSTAQPVAVNAGAAGPEE